MISPSEVFKIGRIGRTHGVKGEVYFFFDDDVFDRVEAEYLILEIDGILVPFFMEEYRFHGNNSALVKFCDIDNQERARELTNCEVFFPHSLADNDPDSISYAQIKGFQLLQADGGQRVGIIQDIDDSTLNVLFEVLTDRGDTILIPASDDLIEDIDTQARTITIHIPDGLLSL